MKKSQAAMEFLLVYGWVILAALVAIFAFIQFGSFSAEAFAVCNVGSGFTCVSSQITTSGVDLYIQNALPVDLTNVVVNITNTNQGKCIASSPKNIAAQGKEEFFISCSGIIDESNFKGDIKITYTKSGSGLSQLSSGSLTGKTLKDKTAPLITMGALTYVAFLPTGPLSPFTVLPIQIFNWVSRPQKEFLTNAAAAILILLLIPI